MDASIPSRVWQFEVRQQRDGHVEVPESALDIPDGATFEDIQELAAGFAQQQARVDGPFVDWLTNDVEMSQVSWT